MALAAGLVLLALVIVALGLAAFFERGVAATPGLATSQAADLVLTAPGEPAPAPPDASAASTARSVQEPRAQLSVRVESSVGEPLPSAHVGIESGAQWRDQGTADAHGRWSTTARLEPPARIVAWAEGFATTRAELPEPAPAEWTIRLVPEASIDGRVVETKSGTGVADVRVLAWEDDGEASPDDARRAARADGSITAALSGADGAFSIRGLTPGQRYAVAAAGAGFARADVRRAVAAGTSGLKLGVRRAWGALLRLREADGSAPRTSTSYYGRGFGTARWPEPDADVLGSSSPQAWLAGLDSPAPAELGYWDRLILFTAEEPQEGAPRAQFRAHLPGYEPVDTSIPLQPLGAELPEVVVTLTPEAAGLGELHVRWLGNLPAPALPTSEYAPVGYVVLRGPGNVEHSFALREPWLEGWKLSGVPRGDWTVSYETESTGLRVIARECAEAPLRIGELGASATFDLRTVGALAVVVRDSAGAALQGRLSLALESLAADGSSVRRWPLRMFRRAPYVLSHVPEGLYAVHVLAPGRDAGEFVAPLSVQVRPGTVEEFTLDLPGH